MPITEAHAGRSYPPTPPYEITAVKVAEFTTALDDPGLAYQGERPLAPPTFVAVLAAQAWEAMFADAELGLALRRIVHADQRFALSRPLRVGDRVTATLTLDRVRTRGPADIISSSVLVATEDGEPVGTASATFYHSREAVA